VSLSNSTLNIKLTLKIVKGNISNEEKRRKWIGTYKSHVPIIKCQGRKQNIFIMASKIDNMAIEKENKSLERDLIQGMELRVINVTSLSIFKRIVESTKYIKKVKAKIRMKKMVQL